MIALSTGSLYTYGIARVFDLAAQAHLSNYDGREHRSPPDGSLRLGSLLQALTRDGYRGAVTVECHPDALKAEDAGTCLAALRRAQSFCRAHYEWR